MGVIRKPNLSTYVQQWGQLLGAGGSNDFSVVQRYWNDEIRASTSVSIDLGGPILKSYFSEIGRFENDLAPAEFRSLDAHLSLLDYMKQLAILFHQDVELTVENAASEDEILMVVTKASVEIIAGSSSQISAHKNIRQR